MFILTFLGYSLLSAMAAYPDTSEAIIKNEIPYGQRAGGLLGRGTVITALLCVEDLSQGHIAIDYEIAIPGPLRPLPEDRDIKLEKGKAVWILKTSFCLNVEGEKWFRVIRISIPKDTPCQEYPICASATIQGKTGKEVIRQISRLRVVSTREMRDYLEIKGIIIPSNEEGEPDGRQEQDSFLIKGKGGFWQRLAPVKGKGPATYATVVIRNKAPYRTVLLVELDILDPKTGKKARGFEYPFAAEHGDLLGRGEIYQVVALKPQDEERVILPIYTKQGVVLPGIYLARVSLFPFGTTTNIGQKDVKIEVISARYIPVLMTIMGIITAVVGCSFFYWKRRQFLEMKATDLILIALFGTVMFTVVNIPGTLLFNVAHVLLGPFSFLLTGLFYNVVFYLLLISLLVLIPKVGVVTLVIAVRFLMGSFILGEFSPLSLIYYPTMATVLEGTVYLLGLTRRGQDPDRKGIILTAAAMGLADTYISLVFFSASMLFYRLYYANWYIGAYLVIDSFFFTLLAVPFGFRLGRRLRAVSVV